MLSGSIGRPIHRVQKKSNGSCLGGATPRADLLPCYDLAWIIVDCSRAREALELNYQTLPTGPRMRDLKARSPEHLDDEVNFYLDGTRN